MQKASTSEVCVGEGGVSQGCCLTSTCFCLFFLVFLLLALKQVEFEREAGCQRLVTCLSAFLPLSPSLSLCPSLAVQKPPEHRPSKDVRQRNNQRSL
jgi:hypothetical protein